MRREIYLKVKAIDRKTATNLINTTLISMKSGARVGDNNIIYSEKIPYDGLRPFTAQKYIFTFKTSIEMPESIDIDHLANVFSRYEIGLLESIDDRRSIMIDMSKDKINEAKAKLEEYGVAEDETENVLSFVFGILLA